jgi:activator of HSP90 ATPase
MKRSDFAFGATVLAALGFGARAEAAASATNEISHSNAAIHQEVQFQASPARVYMALTVAAQFDLVVRASFSADPNMMKALRTAPTAIDAKPGGAFSLFGGYITGRNLELMQNVRIVQAWRAGSWEPGKYSIVEFVLAPHDSGTKIVFDHVGFPNPAAQSLADGWHAHYWQPMAKVLA